MTDESGTTLETTRRGALAGIGMVGVAAAVAACGGGSGGTSGSSGSSTGGSSGGSSSALGTTSEIPVGGGKIFTSEKVVVTQPTAGQFKGFSAICTHMGCTVDQVADGTIDCPCHGSKYSITDAHVVHGPAPKPLPVKNIKVANGKITLA
ncbi:MAG TPA: Rieske (2Fe-2S) protein [Streptosporangiaceae bacterium]